MEPCVTGWWKGMYSPALDCCKNAGICAEESSFDIFDERRRKDIVVLG